MSSDPEPLGWYGWLRRFGRWRRLTGPHADMGTASRALDAELRKMGVRCRSLDLALTMGGTPQLDRPTPAPETHQAVAGAAIAAEATDRGRPAKRTRHLGQGRRRRECGQRGM
jgi:hypothetical protein